MHHNFLNCMQPILAMGSGHLGVSALYSVVEEHASGQECAVAMTVTLKKRLATHRSADQSLD